MIVGAWSMVCFAQSDPVLMTVAGRDVTRSEFEYSLNKNYDSPSQVSEQDIKDYVDLFVNYRMKVQAALDARLDTLSSFQTEYRTYRDVQLKPFVYDSLYADSVIRSVYDNLKESVGDSDIACTSIFCNAGIGRPTIRNSLSYSSSTM